MRNPSLSSFSSFKFSEPLRILLIIPPEKMLKGGGVEEKAKKGKEMNEKVKHELVLCLDDENKN